MNCIQGTGLIVTGKKVLYARKYTGRYWDNRYCIQGTWLIGTGQ